MYWRVTKIGLIMDEIFIELVGIFGIKRYSTRKMQDLFVRVYIVQLASGPLGVVGILSNHLRIKFQVTWSNWGMLSSWWLADNKGISRSPNSLIVDFKMPLKHTITCQS